MSALAQHLGFIATLLSQVVFALLSPGFVICQEADGEVQLEWRLSTCCADEVAGSAGQALTPRVQGGDTCEGCTDTELSVSLISEDGKDSLVLPVGFAMPEPARPDLQGQRYLPAYAASPVDSLPSHLRTVILRS